MRRFLPIILTLLLSMPTLADQTPSPTVPGKSPAQILSQSIEEPLILQLCFPETAGTMQQWHPIHSTLTLTSVKPINRSQNPDNCYQLSFRQRLNTHVAMLSLGYHTSTAPHTPQQIDLVLDMMTHTVSILPNQKNTPHLPPIDTEKTNPRSPIGDINNLPIAEQEDEPLFEKALLEEDRTLPHPSVPPSTTTARHLSLHHSIGTQQKLDRNGQLIELLTEQNALLKMINTKLDRLLSK